MAMRNMALVLEMPPAQNRRMPLSGRHLVPTAILASIAIKRVAVRSTCRLHKLDKVVLEWKVSSVTRISPRRRTVQVASSRPLFIARRTTTEH